MFNEQGSEDRFNLKPLKSHSYKPSRCSYRYVSVINRILHKFILTENTRQAFIQNSPVYVVSNRMMHTMQ